MPVIFISGGLDLNVLVRYLLDRYARNHHNVYDIVGKRGWLVWVTLLCVFAVAAWFIASVVPNFNALLAIIASAFLALFCYIFPALFWFRLVKEGHWWSRRNIVHAISNGAILLFGLAVLFGGGYAAFDSLWHSDKGLSVCSSAGYID